MSQPSIKLYKTAALISILLFITFSYFFQSGQDNANTRFDQARTIIEDQTLHIDRFAYNSADVITFNKHVYPNKAPGATFLALPPWVFFSKILNSTPLRKEISEHFTCYLTTLSTVGLATIVLAAAMLCLLTFLTQNLLLSSLITLAYGLGTIAFPFSTLLFSHQLAAALLFIPFCLIVYLKYGSIPKRTQKIFLLGSGIMLSMAAATEYPAAMGAILIGAYSLHVLKFSSNLTIFILGGVIGALPLAAYNYIAFNDLLFIPYSSYAEAANSPFPDHAQGLMGVSIPSLKNLLSITFLPQRGLFFFNPWLTLLIPALTSPFLVKKFRWELGLCALVSIAFIVFNAGYGDSIVYWGGGASVGPRHMIPMLPFAAVLIAPLLQWSVFRFLFYPLAVLSSLFMLLATAVEPRVPYEYLNPITDLFWPNYIIGRLAIYPNGIFSNILLTDNSVAFNIGKLFGLPGSVQLIPLLVVWTILLALIFKQSSHSRDSKFTTYGTITLAFIFLIFASVPIVHAYSQSLAYSANAGLLGHYSRGIRWSEKAPPNTAALDKNKVTLERIDKYLFFPWDEEGAVFPGSFSVQWTGYIYAPTEGTYTLATRSDDGSAVYINDKLLVNNWGSHQETHAEGNISLPKGYHKIFIIYYNSQFSGSFSLLWKQPHGHLDTIPQNFFYLRNPELETKN